MLQIPPQAVPHARRRAVAALALLLLAGLAPAVRADDYPMPAWATSHVSSAMCRGSQIHLVATGTVQVAYERVYAVLLRTNILKDVEAAYLREMKPGEKTNLVVTAKETPGHYRVDWRDEQGTYVRDVWRDTDTNTFFAGGFILTGRRFFGEFETVLNVRVQRAADGTASFLADVLIYPHNGLIRFIFNNLISVESHFRDVMTDLSAEIERLCTLLCRPDAPPATAPPGAAPSEP